MNIENLKHVLSLMDDCNDLKDYNALTKILNKNLKAIKERKFPEICKFPWMDDNEFSSYLRDCAKRLLYLVKIRSGHLYNTNNPKIEMIKWLAKESGRGLAESKKFCETYFKEYF